MKKLAIAFLIATVSSCISAPTIQLKDYRAGRSVKQVCIKAIEFYRTDDYLEKASPHPYMDEARRIIRELSEKKLKEEGFEFVDCAGDSGEEIHAVIDIAIFLGIYPVIRHRTQALHKGELLFEISGSASSPSYNRDAIIKVQEAVAADIARMFTEKIRSYNR